MQECRRLVVCLAQHIVDGRCISPAASHALEQFSYQLRPVRPSRCQSVTSESLCGKRLVCEKAVLTDFAGRKHGDRVAFSAPTHEARSSANVTSPIRHSRLVHIFRKLLREASVTFSFLQPRTSLLDSPRQQSAQLSVQPAAPAATDLVSVYEVQQQPALRYSADRSKGLSLRGATAASPSILSRQEASVVIDVLPCEHRQAPGAAGLSICRSEARPRRERGEQRGLAADNLSHRRVRRAPVLGLDTPCRSRRQETRS